MVYLLTVVGGLACAPSDPGNEDRALSSPDLWTITDALIPGVPTPAEDSFCSAEGYKAEQLGSAYVFSVLTVFCNHLSVTQPTLTKIKTGETLRMKLWHSQLTAPVDSTAHVFIGLGDLPLWEETYPIPTLEGSLTTSYWNAPHDIPAGTPLFFHVRNHGANEYSLVEISVVEEIIDSP